MMKLNKKGFTLVELLAVIVVLALVMVVAGRAIGGSLESSKKNAMKTEAQKIVSKTYEDLESARALGIATDYTYANVAGNGYTEGDYTVKIYVNGYDMKYVCVKYNESTPKYSLAKIDIKEISYDVDGNPSTADVFYVTEKPTDGFCSDSTKTTEATCTGAGITWTSYCP